MSQSTLTSVSILLGIVASFAFQTGNFLLGAVTLIVHGALTLYVGPSAGKRIVGGLMIGFGLYVLALVLGLLLHVVAHLVFG